MPTQTHTVTIAQALASNVAGLLVLDLAINIANALPNAGLSARVTSFTVSAPAILGAPQLLLLAGLGAALHAPTSGLQLNSAMTVTAAQLIALEAMPGFSLGHSASITLSDTTAQVVSLLATHPAFFTQIAAVAVHLDGTSIGAYPATQLNGLAVHGKALSFVPSSGHTTLNIAAAAHDLGSNVLALNALEARQALSFTVTNDGAGISASDATGLDQLQGFVPGSHTLYVADTGASIAAHAVTIFGQGFTRIQINTGTFAGTAAQLLDPALHFQAGSHAQLVSAASLSATAAAALAALPGFSLATGITLAVRDTASNLIATASSWLSVATTATLIGNATLSAPGAVALALIASTLGTGFSLGGNSLTIADSLAGLANLTAPVAALASAITLNANAASATATQLAAFAALPHATLGGFTIAVTDSAANLAGLSAASLTDAASLTLSAGAIVNATTLTTLFALHGFSLGGHVLNLVDTATALLALSAPALALAGTATLAADATVTAAQATILAAEPAFSAGTYHLTIADTAEALLGLPHALQLSATSLSLVGDQSVTASVLTQIASLGIKFSEAGHALTVVDTAAHLTALQPAATSLAIAELLNVSASVTAATALTLATLPNLGVVVGTVLTVQDSVANLIAMGQGAPVIASIVKLTPGYVTITAAQGQALSAIPHFTTTGTTITVVDTVADLTSSATLGWQTVASSVHVVDTATDLAANAAGILVHSAAEVTLSANAQVSAAAAVLIATIPAFSVGSFQLSVADTAAAIAANQGAILHVATAVVVTDSGPITTAAADQLALISAAGLLTFQGGDQLIVQDSYAAIIDQANVTGVSLAARLTVLDNGANLATASSHDWGALNPKYQLSQGGSITAAQAATLAGLGTHFAANGYMLTVHDMAAAVVGAASALTALHIVASVTDTIPDLSAQQSALLSMGAAINSIQVSASSPVTAASAAGISGLAGLLAGLPLEVADTAADVDASRAGLYTLGTHAITFVTDTAANVAAVASDLAILHNALVITLSDTVPVAANVAAGLLPVNGNLTLGTALAVSDTGANVASHVTDLSALGYTLGTLTLSDGNTQSAAIAAALSVVCNHLGSGVMLTATGTGADITANQSGLTTLQGYGHLAAVSVSATSVADAVGNAAALQMLSANVTISDTAARVDAALDSLAGIGGLQAVALTDGGAPTLSMSLATLVADGSVLAKISTPFTITVSDTGADITADLILGDNSAIVANLGHVTSIVANDGQAIVLNQVQILAPGMDDGPGSVLAKSPGVVTVHGVDIAHLAQVSALGHAPVALVVDDTSAAISTDLALGGASVLLANIGNLARIIATDNATVTLTAAQALATNVDDTADSAIGRLQGATLSITSASVAQLSALAGMHVLPTTIAVSDSALNLSNDLASGASLLLAGLPTIQTVTVADGGAITLTETQLLTAQVDDGTGSILSMMTGGTLAVTNVLAADLEQMLTLAVAPTSISITDTGVHLISNIAGVIAALSHIAAINVSGAAPVLTAAEALETSVNDGTGSMIDKLVGHAFTVSGATISQIGTLLQPARYAPATIGICDTSNSIVTDLTSGSSVLASNIGVVGAITVTHHTLTLTDGQADTILQTALLDNVLVAHLLPTTNVYITEVPVSDLAAFAGSSWPHVTMAIADTATAIAADLNSGSSLLSANYLMVGSVALDAGGQVDVATLTAMSLLPNFTNSGFALAVVDGAAAVAGLGTIPGALASSVSVVDTDSNVTGQLDALQGRYAGALAITLTNGSPSITIAAAQYAADHATIDAITSPGTVTVMGSANALASLATQLGADIVVGRVMVTDTAVDVISNLANLQSAGGKLAVVLSDTSLTANLVAPLLTIANLSPSGIPVIDTGSQLAAVVETGNTAAIAYLNANFATLAGDSVITATDAVALEALTQFTKAGHQLDVWDTALHLTSPTYAGALANAAVNSVHLKAPGGIATVTAATATSLFAIASFVTTNPDGTSNVLNVSDTASHIDTNLAGLASHAGSITHVFVNASAVITDQVLSDLQSLQAMAINGAIMTVRDTAAIIATNAAAQTAVGQVLPASYWTLSSSGTVNEAQAVILGNLAGFTTGANTITINLSADTTISVADANALGNIAGALNLNGHHLLVTGSVSLLSTLSPAALGLVTPALRDTAQDVITLAAASPLLHGTVELTDSGPLSPTNASALLGLVSTSGSPGILPGSLTFDNNYAVTDSIANLHILTGSAAWTANVALHGSFQLGAVDDVTALINPSNTAYLSAVTTSYLQTAIISASAATSLAGVASAIHFSFGNQFVTIADTAANILNAANASGLSHVSLVTLSGIAHLDAADTEQLLGIAHLSITTPLSVVDSSANLLDGSLSAAIASSGFAGHISVQLAGPETLDAQTAESLVSLPGFADTANLTIADSVSYLLDSANFTAEHMAASVTLADDETVTANTVLRLSEVPHFSAGSSHLVLAGNDFADAATLKALGDAGSAFVVAAHTVTMTQDALDLTPSEYNALQSDNVVQNSHAMGVLPGLVSVTDTPSLLSVSGTGFAGGTVHIYAADGTLITSNAESGAGFTVTAPDTLSGLSFSITETVHGTEGAPLVVLDANTIESAVLGHGGSFASTGSIQVDTGKFVELYTAGAVPTLIHAALIYDPVAHTVSLDLPGNTPITLVTLGSSTHPGSLDLSEILIKHHG